MEKKEQLATLIQVLNTLNVVDIRGLESARVVLTAATLVQQVVQELNAEIAESKQLAEQAVATPKE